MSQITTQVGMVRMGEAMHELGQGEIWKISLSSLPFCCDPKSTKKIAFYKKQTTHFFCVKLIKRCQNSFLGRRVIHDFQIPL